MGTCIDLIGRQFGELLVIGKSAKRTKNGSVFWVCKCSCGNIKEISGASLKNGRTISCGHIGIGNLEKGRGRYNDLTGKKYGALTVLYRAEDKYNKVHWVCRCECGRESTVMADNLRNGNTQSCGFCGNNSHGNLKIQNLLESNSIPFEREKRFETCKDIQCLPFDFYVEDSYCIEYDGKQHFYDSFLFSNPKIIEHDEIKTQWCRDNNIPLIRIPYIHYNELQIDDLKLETSDFIVA